MDRQNFDPAQRRTWLEIGNEFPLVSVRCMVMGTTAQECEARLRRRTNHPTIDSVPLALQLLDKFIGLWVQPALNEVLHSAVGTEMTLTRDRGSTTFSSSRHCRPPATSPSRSSSPSSPTSKLRPPTLPRVPNDPPSRNEGAALEDPARMLLRKWHRR